MSFANGFKNGEVLYAGDLNDLREYLQNIGQIKRYITIYTDNGQISNISLETFDGTVQNIDINNFSSVHEVISTGLDEGTPIILDMTSERYSLLGTATNGQFFLYNYNFMNEFNPIDSYSCVTISGGTVEKIKLEYNEV